MSDLLVHGGRDRPPVRLAPLRPVERALGGAILLTFAAGVLRVVEPYGAAPGARPTPTPSRTFERVSPELAYERELAARRTTEFVRSQNCPDRSTPAGYRQVSHLPDYSEIVYAVRLHEGTSRESGLDIVVTAIPGGVSYRINRAYGECHR